MRPPLQADSATKQRAAATIALAFACATITSFAGVLALRLPALRLAPAFRLEMLPDSTWPASWLPGAVTAAQQQRAAADQWLHLVLVFGVLTITIACVNALIGLLVHANERRYETAVRAIVGAAPRQLRRGLRANALLNAGIGVVPGVPAGLIAASLIRTTWPATSANPTAQAWALLALSLSLAVAAFAAHITARRFRKPGWMGDAMAPGARSLPGIGAEELRALLTTAQLACAIALTTVSLMVWSFVQGAQKSRGIAQPRPNAVVQLARVSLPQLSTQAERQQAYASILAGLRADPSVEAESIASPGALLGIGKVDKVISECGRCSFATMIAPLFPVEAQQHVVGPAFFETAGIALRSGREFAGNPGDQGTVIVNDSFARFAFQGQNPLGKRIRVGGLSGDWFRVIGLVPDVPPVGLQFVQGDPLTPGVSSGNAPALYFSAATHAPAVFDVVIRATGAPPTLAGFDFRPLTDVLARASAQQLSFVRIIAVFGLLLCCAAAIGTFMTTTMNVKARRTEIAVRRALGARRRDIRRLIYGALAGVVIRGALMGLITAAALTRVVEMFVPGLPAFDIAIATVVCVSFGAIAFGAALLPAREALRIAPAQAQG